MEFAFNGKLHDQAIMDIVTDEKYPKGIYDILDPQKKEIVQQVDKKQFLACVYICQSDRKRYGRLIE